MSDSEDEETDYSSQILLQYLQQIMQNGTNNNNNNNTNSNTIPNFLKQSYPPPPQQQEQEDNSISYPTKDNKKLIMSTNTEIKPLKLSSKLKNDGIQLSSLISSSISIEIPWFISSKIILYTLSLVPGYYYFNGSMGSGGYYSSTNPCTCRIVLDDQGHITGGFFQELYDNDYNSNNGFKYEITHGTFDYITGQIQFTKWYFPFNYKYKCYGQIGYKINDKKQNERDMIFNGRWERLGYNRGGILKMKLSTDKTNNVTLQQPIQLGMLIITVLLFNLTTGQKLKSVPH